MAACRRALFALLLPAVAFAADPPLPVYQSPTPISLGGSPAWLLVRGLCSLALVIVFIYLAAALAKARGNFAGAPTGYRLKVVETIALAPGRTLHLVSVGEQVLLLGSGSDGMRTLATFSAAELGYDPVMASAPPDSFLAKLQARAPLPRAA